MGWGGVGRGEPSNLAAMANVLPGYGRVAAAATACDARQRGSHRIPPHLQRPAKALWQLRLGDCAAIGSAQDGCRAFLRHGGADHVHCGAKRGGGGP